MNIDGKGENKMLTITEAQVVAINWAMIGAVAIGFVVLFFADR